MDKWTLPSQGPFVTPGSSESCWPWGRGGKHITSPVPLGGAQAVTKSRISLVVLPAPRLGFEKEKFTHLAMFLILLFQVKNSLQQA